jgi:3-oxoacyl-[acyl-carrier-protein] synthase-3
MRRARVVGTGLYVPERVVTNHDLEKLMDTSDEWIQKRSGIRERRFAADWETPADMAKVAAERTLGDAGLGISDVDCIVLATLSPQHEFPGTSFFLHELLDAPEIPCFDLRAQCTGFLYSLATANAFVRSGQFERVLVLGVEIHSAGIELTTRGRDVAVLFGDGAAGVILEASEGGPEGPGVLAVRLHAEGKHAKKLWIEAPGCGLKEGRITHEMIDSGRIYPKMDGKFVFKHAVTRMPEVLHETLSAASAKLEDVDLFLFHQANLRINEYVAGSLGIPPEKCLNNIDRYGNCSAASIPLLLAEARQEGRAKPGDLVAMTAFGSGFSWGCGLLRL